jgi:hypothetical protein
MKKIATEVKVGDTIQSNYFKSYWGLVTRIEETEKQFTFHVILVAGEAKGHNWCYTFRKTTKVICK